MKQILHCDTGKLFCMTAIGHVIAKDDTATITTTSLIDRHGHLTS